MKIKRVKVIVVVVIIISLLLILSSCNNEEEVFENFPVSTEELTDVLYEEEINWNISGSASPYEYARNFQLEDENGKTICWMFNNSFEDYRSFQYMFFRRYGPGVGGFAKHIEENEWESVLRLVSKLYGDGEIYEEVYSELVQYSSERNGEDYGDGIFIKRVNDIHITIRLIATTASEFGYDLAEINMMSNSAYESYQFGFLDTLERRAANEGGNVIKSSTIPELSQNLVGDTDDPQCFIVQGHLKNIQETEVEDLPNTIMSSFPVNNDATSHYNGDYFKATLKNDTGTIEVIGRKNSFTGKELKEARNHFITYIPNDDVYFLQTSAMIVEEGE